MGKTYRRASKDEIRTFGRDKRRMKNEGGGLDAPMKHKERGKGKAARRNHIQWEE